MKIKIKVVPGSSQSGVKEEQGIFKVYVHASPDKGKANKEVIETLADFFSVSRSSVTILQGLTSRNKTVAVEGSTRQP